MLSPPHFAPQFESHYWPSPSLKKNTFGAQTQDKVSRKNLFASKEEQVNNLMKVNIIFKNLICHFYEFYVCQRYLSYQMVQVLKQLCIENEMMDDMPTDENLIEGFMEIFVLPLFTSMYVNNNYAHSCTLSDGEVKKELDIQIYPLQIKTEIESLSYRMAVLLMIACTELQLDDEQTVFTHLDDWKSVRRHNLKLSILAYKSWLNSLCLKHYCHHAIAGFLRELSEHDEDAMFDDFGIIGVILSNFYCPFGSDKSMKEVRDVIYGTFEDACGEQIAVFVQSIMNTIMGAHVFVSSHCAELERVVKHATEI